MDEKNCKQTIIILNGMYGYIKKYVQNVYGPIVCQGEWWKQSYSKEYFIINTG